MLLSVIIHAICVTRFPEKIKCKPHIHEKFSFFLLVGSLYKCLKNLTMFLALTMLIPVIVHAIRVTRFPKKIKCKPHIHEKFSFFLLVGSLYKCLKNLTMFLALTMLIPVIVHAIRVTRFPKKIKCKPHIHEKFSFFLLVGSLYKCLKNLTMFLALTMLIPVIVHAIRVTRFPKKIKCKPHIHEKFSFFLLVGSLYKCLKNLLTGNIFLVIIFRMPLHAPHKRFLRQPYAFN